MNPIKEIGECSIAIGETEYLLRPSFRAMMRIGDPEEIVRAFYDLHNDEVTPLLKRAMDAYGEIPEWLISYISRQQTAKPAIMAAISVISACCDSDLTKLIGEIIPGRTGKWTFVYKKGAMPLANMVLIAQSLIVHGIIGKAKVRKLQRHETGEATREFHAFEYIRSARNHFGMTKTEAVELTMTEFQLMLSDKYPAEKGYTKEEYDSKADQYFERRKRRLAKEA
ncbi:DUF6246 family protein [Buttiauxella sp.]|uniref:DUF6246 family protein n=1 Tax=Buttiauxella sp. TaxID=1972222 RepID=UPI003C72A32D